ncbi:MAG: MATE family efflux transporter [Synergistaceae bacterium]|jgi:putative MATE family efflux protein|nr:MATE family efflux transporter [Synergistaceae bacterium]
MTASGKMRFGGFFDGHADLGNDSPVRAILKLAVPSMGLFVFNSLLHLVDTIFVSWLGEFPMTAMSFTGPVNQCLLAMLECVAGGSAALMGRNLGRGDLPSARHVARSALALLYVFCLVSTPLFLPGISNALFAGIGAEKAGGEPLLQLCWLYNMWMPVMLPFMGFTYISNTVLRAQGDTLTPFKSIALANTINLLLDPLFIFTFGWGISGAAIATWISRIASSLYLIRHMGEHSAILVSPWLQPRDRLTAYWKNILWIGVPVALTTASIALGMGSVNKILSTFGIRAVAAWMLGLRVEELAFNFVAGINTALVPFIAFNYGKRDAGRMLAGFKAAYLLAFILMCSMGAVIYSFPQVFLALFRPPLEVRQMAVNAIRASVPAYPFGALVVLSCGFFVGTGHSIFGTLTQLLRSIAFRVTAAWVFATYFEFSRIWWFQSFAAFCGSFVATAFFFLVHRRVKRDFAREAA